MPVRLFRRRTEDRALTRESLPESMMGAPTVAGRVGVHEALRLVDVFACVNLIASVASTLPLIAYRRAGEGRERLVGGRLVELLRKPAPATTQSSLTGQLVASLAARGNAYLGLYRDEEGQIALLGVIDPDRIVVTVVGGSPTYLLTRLDGSQVRLDENDIVHIKTAMTGRDGVLGLSPLGQCREALGLNQALAEEASATAVNASTPKGVLTVTAGPGADDVAENLRSGFSARHQGPTNRGRVAVVTSEVSFSAVSISPHDSELVERQRLSTQEIARIYLPPCPQMVNAPSNDSLTYATTEAQAAAFAKFVLATYLTPIEQAITASPLCVGPSTYVEFLMDALLRPDAKTRAEVYAAALGNTSTGQPGWMTRQEVRQREGLPEEAA
jgi:HK97 family phage portal protein